MNEEPVVYEVKVYSIKGGDPLILKNLIADGFVQELRSRWFVEKYGTRHEYPMEHFCFMFSPDRQKLFENKKESVPGVR